MNRVDLAIVGAGAAGLAAAVFAGEAASDAPRSIVLLEGAKKPGAKILVSGGGRCNVTNERVTPDDYWGGPKPIIRNVLRSFDEKRTIEWMRELGVELKLEPTGKYFPVSDKARSVLDALLARADALGVRLWAGARVQDMRRDGDEFVIELEGAEPLHASRVILATGGLSLPKSGSDGWGLQLAKRLGHSIVPTTPALSPIVLLPGTDAAGRFAELSGITVDARLEVRSGAGRSLFAWTGSTLFTHFGLSGPTPLNVSRHFLRERLEHPTPAAMLCFGHPDYPTTEDAISRIASVASSSPRRTVAGLLGELWPDRLARTLAADIGAEKLVSQLRREETRETRRVHGASPSALQWRPGLFVCGNHCRGSGPPRS
jgi:predicted Rossmann fold flavoprotein